MVKTMSSAGSNAMCTVDVNTLYICATGSVQCVVSMSVLSTHVHCIYWSMLL